MKIKHEQVVYTSTLPFKIFSFKSSDSNRIIAKHWHESTEILFVLNGALNANINNNSLIIKENQFIIINPCVIHSTKALKDSHILCIQYPFSFLSRLTDNSYQKEIFFNSRINNFKQNELKLNIYNLVNHLESSKCDIDTNLSIYILGLTILKSLLKNFSLHSNISNNKNISFMNEFIDYLSQNFTHDLTLEMVAKHFGYSNSYCSRLIKQNLGNSFSDYLISLKIQRAIRLSSQEDLSLEEIAERSGFKCYRNLYNAIKTNYQCSPETAFNQMKL